MDTSLTSNSPLAQFGMTAEGVYSPRLELLQQEMAYTPNLTTDEAAMLGRTIQSVYAGQSGDMNSGAPKSYVDQTLTGNLRDYMPSESALGVFNSVKDSTKSTTVGWWEQIKQWLTEHAMMFLLIGLGVICLIGAFITWKPTQEAAQAAILAS